MKQILRNAYYNYLLRSLRQRLQSSQGSPSPLDNPPQLRCGSSIKYGLFQYGYIPREGYWADEINIGDYIQSLAARQFLPQVDRLVERDAIADYQGDRVRVIMNGWWHFYKGNAVPSKQINPLYVSIHITNPQEVTQETIEHFKQHEPIGCRDHTTMKFLQGKGVDAYFSGCMTLTLGRTYAVPPEERTNTVYYVNFDKNIFVNYLKSKFTFLTNFFPAKARRQLDNVIQTCVPNFSQCRRIYRDHTVPLSMSHEENFRLADIYLRDYARAKLVVTSKIHCALPCAGMGVPVILMMNKPDDPRFDGIKELLNHMGVDTSGEVIQHFFISSGPSGSSLGSSPDIPAITDALAEKCLKFVNAPE